MPYIPKPSRDWARELPSTPGELNFALTMTCVEYLERSEKRYADHAEVVGALEAAKLEFYRRACVPIEKDAIERNGDGIYA